MKYLWEYTVMITDKERGKFLKNLDIFMMENFNKELNKVMGKKYIKINSIVEIF